MVRFHAFRHAFCSHLANAGVSPFQVMKLMGHSSMDVVLTYHHAAGDALSQAVQTADLDRLVGSNNGESCKTSTKRPEDDGRNDS